MGRNRLYSLYSFDDSLNPWLDNLWKTVLELYPLPEGVSVIPDNALESPGHKIEFHTSRNHPIVSYNSKMVENTRITPMDHWQDVRHIVFQNDSLVYESGDVLGIKPKNSTQLVELALQRLKYDPKMILSVPSLPIHEMTLFEVFESILDIQATPKKRFFEIAMHMTKDEKEAEKHEYFAKETAELYKYAYREKRTFLEVLEEFPMTMIPLEYLFDMIPMIQPRYFSISSSPLVTPKEIHITVAIVSFETPYRRKRLGFCSNWFSTMINQPVEIFVRKGSIKMPNDPKTPIVMIGPGTGMAPFRSFALSRNFLSQTDTVGKSVLFFGNRNSKMDYFYQTELEGLQKTSPFRIITAFSRDQTETIYVQDRIEQNANLILDCIQNGGIIYVAGNAKKMPRDVRNTILQIISSKGGLSQDDANKYLTKMELTGRYNCETWH